MAVSFEQYCSTSPPSRGGNSQHGGKDPRKSESTPIPRHVPAPKSAINISAPRVVEPVHPEAWQEDWTNSDARNQFLIVNAIARVPGSDLPHRLRSLLNRFRTGQGLCTSNLHLWGLRADPLYECGLRQSMTHIVEDCHLTRLQGGLRALHSADEAAVVWLDKTSKR